MTVRKDRGAFRNHRLPKHARAQENFSAREPFRDGSGDALILKQAKPEQLRSDLTSDVITGGSETTGDNEDIATAESLQERIANRGAIRDGRLSGNPQTKRKELLTEVGQVRVRDAAKEQLRPGIEDLNVHSRFEFVSFRIRQVAVRRRSTRRKSLNALAREP